VTEAMRRFVSGPGVVDLVTFGAGHPGAAASGARVLYERLGLTPAGAAAPAPKAAPRQVYRKTIAYKHARQKTQYGGEIAQDRT